MFGVVGVRGVEGGLSSVAPPPSPWIAFTVRFEAILTCAPACAASAGNKTERAADDATAGRRPSPVVCPVACRPVLRSVALCIMTNYLGGLAFRPS